MNDTKKNNDGNNGFSLVELIVVVLIMGIISIALFPQVYKWVDRSRKASDLDYMERLESAVQLAMMDSDVLTEVAEEVSHDGPILLVVDGSRTYDKNNPDGTSKLLEKTAELLGLETASLKKRKVSASGGKIEISITGGRVVGDYTVDGLPVEDLTN